MEEKIEKLLSNPVFQKEMESAATMEDALKILNRYGIQLTPEALHMIRSGIKGEAELNESELDNVAGGSALGAFSVGWRVLSWLVQHYPPIHGLIGKK